jgi:hypothetical protein
MARGGRRGSFEMAESYRQSMLRIGWIFAMRQPRL